MKFKLEIECENEAFDEEPGSECARILRLVANRIEGLRESATLFGFRGELDHNGNSVCSWGFVND